jgi:hypothetical protein
LCFLGSFKYPWCEFLIFWGYLLQFWLLVVDFLLCVVFGNFDFSLWSVERWNDIWCLLVKILGFLTFDVKFWFSFCRYSYVFISSNFDFLLWVFFCVMFLLLEWIILSFISFSSIGVVMCTWILIFESSFDFFVRLSC